MLLRGEALFQQFGIVIRRVHEEARDSALAGFVTVGLKERTKLNKQEKTYLYNRLSDEANRCMREFAAGRVMERSEEEVKRALLAAGFVVQDDWVRITRYVTLPPSPEVLANKVAVDAFNKRVREALQEAQDRIYLGADDAVALLAGFKQQLQDLATGR